MNFEEQPNPTVDIISDMNLNPVMQTVISTADIDNSNVVESAETLISKNEPANQSEESYSQDPQGNIELLDTEEEQPLLKIENVEIDDKLLEEALSEGKDVTEVSSQTTISCLNKQFEDLEETMQGLLRDKLQEKEKLIAMCTEVLLGENFNIMADETPKLEGNAVETEGGSNMQETLELQMKIEALQCNLKAKQDEMAFLEDKWRIKVQEQENKCKQLEELLETTQAGKNNCIENWQRQIKSQEDVIKDLQQTAAGLTEEKLLAQVAYEEKLNKMENQIACSAVKELANEGTWSKRIEDKDSKIAHLEKTIEKLELDNKMTYESEIAAKEAAKNQEKTIEELKKKLEALQEEQENKEESWNKMLAGKECVIDILEKEIENLKISEGTKAAEKEAAEDAERMIGDLKAEIMAIKSQHANKEECWNKIITEKECMINALQREFGNIETKRREQQEAAQRAVEDLKQIMDNMQKEQEKTKEHWNNKIIEKDHMIKALQRDIETRESEKIIYMENLAEKEKIIQEQQEEIKLKDEEANVTANMWLQHDDKNEKGMQELKEQVKMLQQEKDTAAEAWDQELMKLEQKNEELKDLLQKKQAENIIAEENWCMERIEKEQMIWALQHEIEMRDTDANAEKNELYEFWKNKVQSLETGMEELKQALGMCQKEKQQWEELYHEMIIEKCNMIKALEREIEINESDRKAELLHVKEKGGQQIEQQEISIGKLKQTLKEMELKNAEAEKSYDMELLDRENMMKALKREIEYMQQKYNSEKARQHEKTELVMEEQFRLRSDLEELVQKLQDEKQECQNELKQSATKIQALEREREDLLCEIENYKSEHSKSLSEQCKEVDELQQTIDTLRKAKETYENECSLAFLEKDNMIRALEREIEAMKTQYESKIEQMKEAAETDLQNQQIYMENIKESKKDLTTELIEKQFMVKKLQNQLEAMCAQHESEKSVWLAEMKAKEQAQEKVVSKLSKDMQLMGIEREQLEYNWTMQLIEKDNMVNALQREIERMKQEDLEYKNLVEQLEASIGELRKMYELEKAASQKLEEVLLERHKLHQEELAEQQQTHEQTLQAERNDFEQRLHEKQTEKENAALIENMEQLLKENQLLKAEINSKENLQQETAQLAEEIVNLRKMYSLVADTVTKLENENAELKERCADAEKARDTWKQELSRHIAENAMKLDETLKEKQKAMDVWESKMLQMQTKCQTLEQSIENMKENYKNMQEPQAEAADTATKVQNVQKVASLESQQSVEALEDIHKSSEIPPGDGQSKPKAAQTAADQAESAECAKAQESDDLPADPERNEECTGNNCCATATTTVTASVANTTTNTYSTVRSFAGVSNNNKASAYGRAKHVKFNEATILPTSDDKAITRNKRPGNSRVSMLVARFERNGKPDTEESDEHAHGEARNDHAKPLKRAGSISPPYEIPSMPSLQSRLDNWAKFNVAAETITKEELDSKLPKQY